MDAFNHREGWIPPPSEEFQKANPDWDDRADPDPLFDPWDDPPPPQFPTGVLPEQMEEAIFTTASRDGLCPGALGMAHLSAVSAASNKSSRFTPFLNSTWQVPPIIWVLAIAYSGQRKTAIEDMAFAPLRSAHADLWREYRTKIRQWQALPAKERRDQAKPEEPISLVVEDVTVEKLQQILAATDRGTFMCRDEMAGLLEFGRYTHGAGASERAFYLQAYEGGTYTVSRISRDSIHIEVNAVTIYGSIQPERLADFPDLAKDGLLQRMNVIRCGPAGPSRGDVRADGLRTIQAELQKLTQISWHRYGTTPEGAHLIRETERLGQQLATIPDYGQGFQGTCSKLHGTHARYAMLLHLLVAPQAATIATETVERAGRLVQEFLLPQARDFFAGLSGSPTSRLRDVAGWVLTKAQDRFLASDLTTGVWSCRGLTTKQIAETVDPLVTGGWVEPETQFPSNRAWAVRADLRSRFAARAAEERSRRQQAREWLRQIGKANPEKPDGIGGI